MKLSDAIKELEFAIIKHGDIELYDENFPPITITTLHVYDDKGENKAVFI